MDSGRALMAGVFVISCFLLLVVGLVFVYAISASGESVPSLLRPLLVYHVQFMLLMAVFGVLSGLLGYTVVNAAVEKKEQAVRTNAEILMKFLGAGEQEVVDLLNKKEGRTTQGEIGRLPGMTRLKAHRIVKKLAERGVLHVEREGKVNMVRLVDELRSPAAEKTVQTEKKE